jgi:hypothetical protein
VARTNRRPPMAMPRLASGWVRLTDESPLVPQSHFSTLLLVVGASSGGVVTRRQTNQATVNTGSTGGRRTRRASSRRSPTTKSATSTPAVTTTAPSPSRLSGRRTRVTAKNASATITRVTCRYRPGAGGPGSGPARPRPWLARTPPRPAPPAGDPHQRDQRGGGRGEAGVVGQLPRVAEAAAGQQSEPHAGGPSGAVQRLLHCGVTWQTPPNRGTARALTTLRGVEPAMVAGLVGNQNVGRQAYRRTKADSQGSASVVAMGHLLRYPGVRRPVRRAN